MPFQDPCLFLFLLLALVGGIVIFTKADSTSIEPVRVDFDTINR